MIKYALKCEQGHSFESWFQSANAFDALANAGHLACVTCGSTAVVKSLMAPRVRPARTAVDVPAQAPPVEAAPENSQNNVEHTIAAIRKQVEETSDYVGDNFAKEARDMHLGDAPERPIYGKAAPEEAKALIEDGVSILPLPFLPKETLN